MIPNDPKPSNESYLSKNRVRKAVNVSSDADSSYVVDCSVPSGGCIPKCGAGRRSLLCNDDVAAFLSIHCNSEVESNEQIENQSELAENEIENFAEKNLQAIQQTPLGAKAYNLRLGTKASRKFTMIEQHMPGFRLDVQLKLSIATTLKDLNCWSDEEDSGTEKEKQCYISDDSSNSSDSENRLEDDNVLDDSNHTDNTNSKLAVKDSLSLSLKLKKKVALTHPKQLKSSIYSKANAKLAMAKKQKDGDRARIRENIKAKAVKLLLQMRKKKEKEHQSGISAALREVSSYKSLTIQRIAISRVQKVFARAIANITER